MKEIKILIVEDQPVVARDLQNTLENRGYAVLDAVSSGEAAIQKIAGLRPGLVLMDIVLKGDMDGIEAAEHIRTRFDVPVIFVSAYANEEMLQRARLTEPFGYIIKPFDERELHINIHLALYKHQMEKKLRQSEERFRTVADFTDDWEYWVDPAGDYVYVSPSCERITGYRADEFVRNPDLLKSIVHADDRSKVVSHNHTTSETGEILPIDFRIVTRSGEERWIGHVCQPVHSADGRYLGQRGSNRDITERVRAEQALHESHRRLEKTLAELREAQEQLVGQERIAAVGQLSAGIAHEFNTILAAMSLHTEMSLWSQDVPPKIREHLDVISERIGRAAELVQQILDFGLRTMLRQETLDLSPLLAETVAALERSLPGDIQVELHDDAQEILVYADLERVRQSVVNLALNARDAMTLTSSAETISSSSVETPSGGKLSITLSCVAGTAEIRCITCGPVIGEAKAWARIDVSDTGVGIPPDVLPHIFEPFFTTRSPLGSGLGLAQVYGIVKQHGGHIDVETELGRGTTFTLYWPAHPAPEPQAKAPLGGSPDLALGDGETILVVEDDDAMRAALVDALEVLNYHALSAVDGQEALEEFERAQTCEISEDFASLGVALVLSDWEMPRMGGLELVRQLSQRHEAVRALILTGHTVDQRSKDRAPAAVVGWLQKPTELEELAQAVARALA